MFEPHRCMCVCAGTGEGAWGDAYEVEEEEEEVVVVVVEVGGKPYPLSKPLAQLAEVPPLMATPGRRRGPSKQEREGCQQRKGGVLPAIQKA